MKQFFKTSIFSYKALIKDTIREIKKTRGRFISILSIVAIGVAFFAGIRASAPDMKYSADQYYDNYNLMDLRILSNFGLEKNDVDEIRKIKGVKGEFPTHSIDVITTINSREVVLKVHGIPIDNVFDSNEDYINRVEIVEGRYPQKSGECLIETGKIFDLGKKIGDKIIISSGKDTDILESIKTREYTVVGIAKTPYYLSYEKGSSDIGNGKVDSFIMIPEDDFVMKYYTEVFVTVDGAKILNSYNDEYFDLVDSVKDKIEGLGITQAKLRYDSILKEANEKLAKGKQEYEDGKVKYEREIESAEKELEEKRFELIEGQILLENKKSQYEMQMKAAQQQIDLAKLQIEQGEETLKAINDQYIAAIAEFNKLKESYNEELNQLTKDCADLQRKINEIKARNEQLNRRISEINAALSDPTLDDGKRAELQSELDSLQNELNENNLKLAQYQAEYYSKDFRKRSIENLLNSSQNAIDILEKQMKEANSQIDAGKADLDAQIKKYEEGKAAADKEFAEADKKIRDGQAALIEGEAKLNRSKKEGAEKLDDAYEKIVKAQKDIDNIGEPEWFVLDRKSHYSYRDYGSAADRMNAIASVFPIFFFLVSALVCLTTMTRMVDEQRESIGTLKALGYSKASIAFKYVAYAAIASIAGSIIGLAAGMIIFPTVIFKSWNIMYSIPEVKFVTQIPLMILTTIVAVLITTFAAIGACYKELVVTPSLLMRPKAPKNGKKIFLERITFIWRKLSFSEKVTARNIFRYKKRFFMTIIGISGCTALLLSGFGIRDSISELASKQFSEITQYEVSAKYKRDSTVVDKEEFIKKIKNDSRVEDVMEISESVGTLSVNNKEISVSIVVPSDIEAYKEFYKLRTRKGHKAVNLGNSGVIITEKLANDSKIKIGDKITVANSDGYKEQVEVKGIVENYVGHIIFMGPNMYKSTYDLRALNNTVLIKLTDNSKKIEDEIGIDLMKNNSIKSATFYTGIAKNFTNMIKSLNIVVIVLIISAGLLAFVVLYNLSNVNISERLREIATIKVLGFYDNEVSAYVSRENILLSIIGSFAGLALGRALHLFIMKVAELDNVMFGRNINFVSYIYSIIITMIFAIFVNRVMFNKLKTIPMVESLKSVE